MSTSSSLPETLSLEEASRVTGKTPTQLQQDIRAGRLATLKRVSGQLVLRTADLVRLYGTLIDSSGIGERTFLAGNATRREL